jgi:Spirocyclase AveC-like
MTMSTVHDPSPSVVVDASRRTVPARGRGGRPVVWFATVGAAALALQIYVYISWMRSEDFRRVSTGADPVPTSVKVWAWISQISVTLLAIGCVVWVTRQCLRERKLTFDAKLLIGWVSCFWLDPVPNWIRPQVFFNSYYVNMGSWVEHIPGWFGPTGSNLPNSLLLEGSAFFTNILGCVLSCVVMRRAQKRWNLSNFKIFCVGVATAMAFFLLMEEYMIWTGWLAWPATIHALSLNAGTIHQMPLTEMVITGFCLVGAMGALRYFKDDRGSSWAERGLDRLAFSGPRASAMKTLVSLLAVIGFANASWLTYNVITIPIAVYADEMPSGFPSYMTNDMCGTPQLQLCPDPSAPFVGPHTTGVDSVPGVHPGR